VHVNEVCTCQRVMAGRLEWVERWLREYTSSRERKKGSLPLRLSTYYLIMVLCLRAHVSMIEMAISQLTACQVHGIDHVGHKGRPFNCGRRQYRRFLLLHCRRCWTYWTYLSSGSYLLLSLRLRILRRWRCCLIRCFCHVEMSCRCILLEGLLLTEAKPRSAAKDRLLDPLLLSRRG